MISPRYIIQLSLFFAVVFAQASPNDENAGNRPAGGTSGPIAGPPNLSEMLTQMSKGNLFPNMAKQQSPTQSGIRPKGSSAPSPGLGIIPKPKDLPGLLKAMGNIMNGKGDLRDVVPFLDYGPDFQSIALSPEQYSHPGTGKYPAGYLTDPSLPGKTIFAPKIPPSGIKMPIIVWGEGGCLRTGSLYEPFLTEIASHGYLILANGPPSVGLPKTLNDISKLAKVGQTKVTDMLESIDWVMAGKGSKYGNIDTSAIIAAGQSCGGSEALTVSARNPRVKMTVLVNSGRARVGELTAPVAIFNGGPRDIAYENGRRTYEALPKGLPAFQGNLDTGHIGTLFSLNGGKFGKAVVSFLEWQFRGDQKAKAVCLNPNSPGSLVSDHWVIQHKNWT